MTLQDFLRQPIQITTIQEIGMTARSHTGLDIGWSVSYHHGLLEIDVPFLRQVQEHARLWLATSTRGPQIRGDGFGVMRTRSNISDPCAVPCCLRAEVTVKAMQLPLGKESPANPTLIGDDEEREASVVESPQGSGCARNPCEVFDLVRVTAINDECVIAIQEDGGSRWRPQ
jgi:hypothetical protein